jgi:hypothetical protein
MAERDLHSEVTIAHVVPPAVYTATEVGVPLDTLGYESVEFVIHVGTALVGGGFTALLEESDASGGTYAAVAAAETLGDLPVLVATDADKVVRVGSIGKERWQRLTLTETGTVSAGVIGAIAILSNPKRVPTDAQAT